MYKLDTNEARKADNTGSMINEIGKYVGTFTQAEDIKAGTGTRGIALNFKSTSGQKARVSIYTVKSDGEKIMGYQMLMAIMTCLGLRDIKPQAGTVTRWDNEARAEVQQAGSIFPELCNKPVGVLLETEDYSKLNGDVGTRMVLKGVFQANTELTASEILDRKTQPEQLQKMVAGLRHRAIKHTKAAPSERAPASAGSTGSGFDDMDDDIPF